MAEDSCSLANLDLGGVRVKFVSWTERDEIAVLQRFDIGLMPLSDNEWTRFKCGLKLIQYMALGIPGVASPVGVNSDIIRNGESGFLAHAAFQWTECMACLLSDPGLRKRIGQAGREVIAARFSLESAAPKLIDTLVKAAARTRAQAFHPDSSARLHSVPRSVIGGRVG